jgi:hypothetical protein
MSGLVHIIYASTAVDLFDTQQLSELLKKAREKNKKLGVSGMLLHSEGNFFQVLEGPESTVTTLYQEICKDKRHKNATKIIQEPIADRVFKDWTMGFLEATSDELQSIDGVNDFFQDGHVFTELKSGRAKKLIAAFKQGRWHKLIKH